MRKWKDVIVCLVCDEEMERQLEEQTSKRRELEITLKLLEKDAWAKQATVGALRKQLEDIKIINQDIGNKIRVRENADTFSSIRENADTFSSMYLLY